MLMKAKTKVAFEGNNNKKNYFSIFIPFTQPYLQWQNGKKSTGAKTYL